MNQRHRQLTRRNFLELSLLTGGGIWLGGRVLANAASGPARVTGSGKKLLILGGTNFVGPALVAAARKRGYTITLFNRGKTNPGLFPDLEQLHGDRKVETDLMAAFEGRKWDAVIDTSGYFPQDVGASASMLKDRIKQYVFISSIAVYKMSQSPINESSPLRQLEGPVPGEITRASYGPLKVLCEQAAQKFFPKRTLVIRPGYIVGPGDPTDPFLYWPLRVARGGEMLAPGTPEDPFQVIDVRDLGEWTLRMVDAGQAGIYNAVGPKAKLGMGQLLTSCKAVTASDVRFTWVPAEFLEKQKVLEEEMPIWLSPSSPNAGRLRTSNQRALAAGLVLRPVVDTVRDTLAWWKTLLPEQQAKQSEGMKPEREAEVLAAWHRQAGPTTTAPGG